MANRYSVYKKDDTPVAIYETSKICALAMGIRVKSFYKYICRMRAGKIKTRKWIIYQEEKDTSECA